MSHQYNSQHTLEQRYLCSSAPNMSFHSILTFGFYKCQYTHFHFSDNIFCWYHILTVFLWRFIFYFISEWKTRMCGELCKVTQYITELRIKVIPFRSKIVIAIFSHQEGLHYIVVPHMTQSYGMIPVNYQWKYIINNKFTFILWSLRM
jgi:hypothetical protein